MRDDGNRSDPLDDEVARWNVDPIVDIGSDYPRHANYDIPLTAWRSSKNGRGSVLDRVEHRLRVTVACHVAATLVIGALKVLPLLLLAHFTVQIRDAERPKGDRNQLYLTYLREIDRVLGSNNARHDAASDAS